MSNRKQGLFPATIGSSQQYPSLEGTDNHKPFYRPIIIRSQKDSSQIQRTIQENDVKNTTGERLTSAMIYRDQANKYLCCKYPQIPSADADAIIKSTVVAGLSPELSQHPQNNNYTFKVGAYPRNLTTRDIPGASPGSLKSSVVKNYEKHHHIKAKELQLLQTQKTFQEEEQYKQDEIIQTEENEQQINKEEQRFKQKNEEVEGQQQQQRLLTALKEKQQQQQDQQAFRSKSRAKSALQDKESNGNDYRLGYQQLKQQQQQQFVQRQQQLDSSYNQQNKTPSPYRHGKRQLSDCEQLANPSEEKVNKDILDAIQKTLPVKIMNLPVAEEKDNIITHSSNIVRSGSFDHRILTPVGISAPKINYNYDRQLQTASPKNFTQNQVNNYQFLSNKQQQSNLKDIEDYQNSSSSLPRKNKISRELQQAFLEDAAVDKSWQRLQQQYPNDQNNLKPFSILSNHNNNSRLSNQNYQRTGNPLSFNNNSSIVTQISSYESKQQQQQHQQDLDKVLHDRQKYFSAERVHQRQGKKYDILNFMARESWRNARNPNYSQIVPFPNSHVFAFQEQIIPSPKQLQQQQYQGLQQQQDQIKDPLRNALLNQINQQEKNSINNKEFILKSRQNRSLSNSAPLQQHYQQERELANDFDKVFKKDAIVQDSFIPRRRRF